MIAEVFAILAGLILLTGLLGLIPALGAHLEKFAKWLGSFQGVIGIIALIIGLWQMLGDGEFVPSLMCIIAGIMLAVGILQALPMVGDTLKKVAKFLGGFQTIIGIVVLLVGIIYLID